MVLAPSKVKGVEGGVIPGGATIRFTIVSERSCTSEAYRQATLAAFSAVRNWVSVLLGCVAGQVPVLGLKPFITSL